MLFFPSEGKKRKEKERIENNNFRILGNMEKRFLAPGFNSLPHQVEEERKVKKRKKEKADAIFEILDYLCCIHSSLLSFCLKNI